MFTKEPDMATYEWQQYFPQFYAWHEVRPRKCGMVKIHENQLNNNR
jgi:hypothetical protein